MGIKKIGAGSIEGTRAVRRFVAAINPTERTTEAVDRSSGLFTEPQQSSAWNMAFIFKAEQQQNHSSGSYLGWRRDKVYKTPRAKHQEGRKLYGVSPWFSRSSWTIIPVERSAWPKAGTEQPCGKAQCAGLRGSEQPGRRRGGILSPSTRGRCTGAAPQSPPATALPELRVASGLLSHAYQR